MVNHDHIHRFLEHFQFQSELLLHSRRDRRPHRLLRLPTSPGRRSSASLCLCLLHSVQMQVILDANIYLADVQLRGIGFQNLFAYVRRTGSELVLPRIVREETVARYSDRLESAIRAVQKVWKPYSDLLLEHDSRDFDAPDVKYEIRALRKLLKSPAKGIRLKYVADFSGVDIHEVVKRGIHRMRPASDEGEELRDVILWLFVLAYAKQSGSPVAFISGDRAFWNENEPAAQVKEDIRKAAVDVRLYRKTADFVAANAPSSEEIPTDALAKMFSRQLIEEPALSLARETLTQEYWGGRIGRLFQSVGELEIVSLKPISGTFYKVDKDHDFAEAKILLKVKYTQPARGQLPEMPPFGIGAATAILGGEMQVPAARNMKNPDFYEIEATVFGRMERRQLISVEVNAVKRLDI